MKLKIRTIIEQIYDDLLNNQIILNNNFTGTPDSDFKIDNVEIKQFRLDPTSGAAFNVNLFDCLTGLSANCTFLHIFAYNSTDNPVENPTPARFRITMTEQGSLSQGYGVPIFVGDMSQFELAGMENFNSDVHINNITVPTGKTINLVVIAGFKN